MPKCNILIASILKPVDDTRMYEKLALSLSQTNKYEINIIGFCSKNKIFKENIHFHPLFCYNRSSIKRIYSSFIFLKKTFKLNPDLLIITTPELLLASCFFKFLSKAQIIYDIQENFQNNILYTATYRGIKKYVLAWLVRVIEKSSSQFICHFFLAEKCYEHELPFIKKKYSILENKFKSIESTEITRNKSSRAETIFLYTGTLSENYGIFQTIDFIKKIKTIRNDAKLLIMGRCAIPATLEKIKEEISGFDYIELIGGDNLVPHTEIVKAIQLSDYGLVSYQPDKSIQNKIPTKLFEYMALQLPIILQDHQPWVEFCAPYQSAIPIDFKDFDVALLNKRLNKFKFYPEVNTTDLLWETEEDKLLKVIDMCCKL